jgi:hypothetical protein
MSEVKGYKVFNPDWTCRGFQYEVGKIFEEDVKPSCCDRGFHFCKKAADCFSYYSFNSKNKVAEVIALGEVDTDGKKSCTNKIQIVREIPWQELLTIVNIGKDCTGYGNTGDWNTGDWNTGYGNTGDRNTGDWNTGDRNTGYGNTGDRNTGNCNTGDWNTGNCNTGDWNTGDRNTGDWNTGNCNTGDWNTGDRNTGYGNTGDRNTGDWNKSSFNTGCFNTEEQKIMLFNKPSDMTYNDWLRSDARYLLNQIPKDVVEWVYEEDMTDEEKVANPTYETTGGYLKLLDESECGQLWWGSLSDFQKNYIRSIPNFDAEIFEQCTGIKVDE